MSSEAVKIRVLAVDAHPLLREGVAALIADETDIALVGEARHKSRRTFPHAPP
jgi:DNA-binding NarL/FixJ family response regulator